MDFNVHLQTGLYGEYDMQLTCGSELALLLIHDLEADGAEKTELHRVSDILEAIQVPYTASSASPEVAEATKIGSAAIRWAKKMVLLF